jgi:hypothetical protein
VSGCVCVAWKTLVRVAAVMAMAVALGGCLRDPYVGGGLARVSGNWQIERAQDRVAGRTISSAYLFTRRSSHTNVSYPLSASLQLTCFRKQPIVKFEFETRVGSNRNSALGYRFDDKPGHEVTARFLNDFRTVVIEDRAEVVRFVDELTASESVYVRIDSLNAGRTATEFLLNGAQAAIASAFADCPLNAPASAPAPATQTSALR